MVRSSRREFLLGGAALCVSPRMSVAESLKETLSAEEASIQLLPERYGQTRIWGFEGAAPGPEIRLMQGSRVKKRLINNLPEATSTHWHGVRIDNAMDGVAGLTQNAIVKETPPPLSGSVKRTARRAARSAPCQSPSWSRG